MAASHILTTLRAKRDAIESALKAYEAKAEQCRRDLAHVNATLALFAVGEAEPSEVRAYMDTSRLFRRGELSGLRKAALASYGPQDTRELAKRVAEAKRTPMQPIRSSGRHWPIGSCRRSRCNGSVAGSGQRGAGVA